VGTRHSSLNIADEREQKEEGREAGEPLDNIGYRLCLDGMSKPDEASQESDRKGISSAFPLI